VSTEETASYSAAISKIKNAHQKMTGMKRGALFVWIQSEWLHERQPND